MITVFEHRLRPRQLRVEKTETLDQVVYRNLRGAP